ncbi:MAG: nucleoside hydrolase [Anaerolineae bacterium]
MRPEILLDTDIGGDVDDALALALALRSPEIHLALITTVFADSVLRARIARKIVSLANIVGIPVVAGCNLPLLRRYIPTLDGHEGRDLILDDEDGLPITPGYAVDHLVTHIMEAAEPPILVTIGPLTNVALALVKEPAIAKRVREVVIMGGYVYPAQFAGHIFPPRTDYNLVADPEAARLVLEAGWPITLVPIEITTQVWLDNNERAELRAAGSPLALALSKQIDNWVAYLEHALIGSTSWPREAAVAFLHDPLALATAFEHRFVTLTALHIRVEMEDGVPRTLPDPLKEPNMQVVTRVDAQAFKRWLLDRLKT